MDLKKEWMVLWKDPRSIQQKEADVRVVSTLPNQPSAFRLETSPRAAGTFSIQASFGRSTCQLIRNKSQRKQQHLKKPRSTKAPAPTTVSVNSTPVAHDGTPNADAEARLHADAASVPALRRHESDSSTDDSYSLSAVKLLANRFSSLSTTASDSDNEDDVSAVTNPTTIMTQPSVDAETTKVSFATDNMASELDRKPPAKPTTSPDPPAVPRKPLFNLFAQMEVPPPEATPVKSPAFLPTNISFEPPPMTPVPMPHTTKPVPDLLTQLNSAGYTVDPSQCQALMALLASFSKTTPAPTPTKAATAITPTQLFASPAATAPNACLTQTTIDHAPPTPNACHIQGTPGGLPSTPAVPTAIHQPTTPTDQPTSPLTQPLTPPSYTAAAHRGAQAPPPPKTFDDNYRPFLQMRSKSIPDPLQPNNAFEDPCDGPVARFQVVYTHFDGEDTSALEIDIRNIINVSIEHHRSRYGIITFQVHSVRFKNCQTIKRGTKEIEQSVFALTVSHAPTQDQADTGLFYAQAKEFFRQQCCFHTADHYEHFRGGFTLKSGKARDSPSTHPAATHLVIFVPACNSHVEKARGLFPGFLIGGAGNGPHETTPEANAHFLRALHSRIVPHLDQSNPFAKQLIPYDDFHDHFGVRPSYFEARDPSNGSSISTTVLFSCTSHEGYDHAVRQAISRAKSSEVPPMYGNVPLDPIPFPTGKHRYNLVLTQRNALATIRDSGQVSVFTSARLRIPPHLAEDFVSKTPRLLFFAYRFRQYDSEPSDHTLFFDCHYTNKKIKEETVHKHVPKEYYIGPPPEPAPPPEHTTQARKFPNQPLLPSFLRPKPAPSQPSAATKSPLTDPAPTKRPRMNSPVPSVAPMDHAPTPAPPGFPVQPSTATPPYPTTIPEAYANHPNLQLFFNPTYKSFVDEFYGISESQTAIAEYEMARLNVATHLKPHYEVFVRMLMNAI
ncbi:unknown protein (Partial), partial [Seminavis robusta]|eukprot:Sro3893_g351750.1 n/a (951) ;mRNA; r:181-3117